MQNIGFKCGFDVNENVVCVLWGNCSFLLDGTKLRSPECSLAPLMEEEKQLLPHHFSGDLEHILNEAQEEHPNCSIFAVVRAVDSEGNEFFSAGARNRLQ